MSLRHRPAPSRLAFLAAALLLTLAPGAVGGQLISLRSVPVASGDQFLVHPVARLGMGSVSIALNDSWLDPFVNPARAADVPESAFFGSPTFYGISADGGAGRTLDLAGLAVGDRWFGGGSLALQQIENEPVQRLFFPQRPAIWPGPVQRLGESAARNVYLHGLVGRRLDGTGFAVGASASWANLDAVDGVDLLYQGSDGVDQRGQRTDLRLGVAGENADGHAFEVLLLYHRLAMTHDVRWIEWVWNEDEMQGEVVIRDEEERDDSRTWGVHTGWIGPASDADWRLGGILTINRKTHPKIPNYQIQDIPRDPGDTWAFNAGVGLARERGPFEFGVDVVVEPVWSETWSVTDTAIDLPGGGRIEPGDKEIENDFFFSNVHLRMGLGHATDRWNAQAGIQASAYDYTLEQYDNVERSRREQDEAWMEWTPTWGFGLTFPDIGIRYAGRLTTGTGRPGVAFTGPRAETLATADFIVAPQGPLTLQDVHVLTHRVTVRIPVR